MASKLESSFSLQIRALRLPKPVPEFHFHPERRWRFDFAWPDLMLAVEVEGGEFIRGRHFRPKGFQEDCRKYAEAARLGWTVLRFPGSMVTSGEAIAALQRHFEGLGQ